MRTWPVVSGGAAILSVASIFLFLAFAAVFLRICAINIVGRKLHIHDYLIFLALLLLCGHVVIIFLAVIYGGVGYHLLEIYIDSPDSITTLLKVFFAANFSWLFSSTAVKASVLFLYLDIFRVQRTFRQVTIGFIVFVGVFCVGLLIWIVNYCHPISKLWQPTEPGSCGDLASFQIATAAINMVLDLAIVVLPLPVVFKLQMAPAKKWKVAGVFAVGAVICLINLARLIQTSIQASDQTDVTYTLVGPAILTSLEVEIGIINACLPTINPIITRVAKKLNSWDFKTIVASRSGWNRSQTRKESATGSSGSHDPLDQSVRSGSKTSGTRRSGLREKLGFSRTGTTVTSAAGTAPTSMKQSFPSSTAGSKDGTFLSMSSLSGDHAIYITRDVLVEQEERSRDNIHAPNNNKNNTTTTNNGKKQPHDSRMYEV